MPRAHRGAAGSEISVLFGSPSTVRQVPHAQSSSKEHVSPRLVYSPESSPRSPRSFFPADACEATGPRLPVPVATPGRSHFHACPASCAPAPRRPPSPAIPALPRHLPARLCSASAGRAGERPPSHRCFPSGRRGTRPAHRPSPPVSAGERRGARAPGSGRGRRPCARRARLIHRGLPLPSPFSPDAPAEPSPSLGLRKGSIAYRRTGSLGPVLA